MSLPLRYEDLSAVDATIDAHTVAVCRLKAW
jgi:hypothetical protein